MEADGADDARWKNALKRASKELEAVASNQHSINETSSAVDGLLAQVSQSVDCLFRTDGEESPVAFDRRQLRNYLALERGLSAEAVPQTPLLNKGECSEPLTRTTGRRTASLRGSEALKAVRRPLQFSNAGKDTCCKKIVNELVGRFDSDTWAVSTSATPADEPGSLAASEEQGPVVQPAASIVATLKELVTDKLRSELDERLKGAGRGSSVRGLPPTLLAVVDDLGEQVAKSCVLDITEAGYSRTVGKVTALYNSRIEVLRRLVEQNARLERVKAAQDSHDASAEEVARQVAEALAFLRSRADQCSAIAAGVQDLRVDHSDTPPVKQAVSACAGNFAELCEERVAGLSAGNSALKALRRDRRAMEEDVEESNRELLGRCKGSVDIWCADQLAAFKGKAHTDLVRELFKEFHLHPDKFVKRFPKKH